MISQVRVKVKSKKLRIKSTKDHLSYTKMCGIKLTLKKSKSYHFILTANVSTLSLSNQGYSMKSTKEGDPWKSWNTSTKKYFGGCKENQEVVLV